MRDMFVKVTRYVTFLLPLFLLASCGATLDQKSEGSGSSAGYVSVELVWPEGYTYDPATGALQADAAVAGRSAPTYVTKIALRVTGEDMDPLNVDIPLDTLTTTVTVTMGERTFGIGVQTVHGETFTGSKTLVVSAETPSSLTIPLEINAPPVIEQVTMSPTSPKKGDTVTFEAFATDPDPDDILSYLWRGYDTLSGGGGTLSGQKVTHLFDHGGDYKVSLTVDDGHGGTATKYSSFSIYNAPPVIQSISVDSGRTVKTSAKAGDKLSLKCWASDADDPQTSLNYTWKVVGGNTVLNGRDQTYTFQGKGDVNLSCGVQDFDGAQVSKSVFVNNGQTPRDGTACSNDYNNGSLRVNIGWTGDTDLDAALSAPNGKKTWFGHLRPGDNSEQCVDVTCGSTGAAVTELFYFKAGTAAPTGTYSFGIKNMKDCTGGTTNQTFTWSIQAKNPAAGTCTAGAGTCLFNVTAGGVAVTGCNGQESCSQASGGATPQLTPGGTYIIKFDLN